MLCHARWITSVCSGVRLVAPLEDTQQLERMGTAEVEFRVHAVQIHTAVPLPGLVQSTDPHITLISIQPRIVLVENFLCATECQARSWSLSSACLLLPQLELAYSARLLSSYWQSVLVVRKACQFSPAL